MKCRLALTAMLAICTTVGVNAFADDDGAKDGRPRGPRPGGPPKAEDIFKRIDSNGDGNVTLDEFKKAHERMQAMMRQHGPPHFGPPHFRPGGPGAGDRGHHPPHHPPFHAGGDHGHGDHHGHHKYGDHGDHHGHHGHHRGSHSHHRDHGDHHGHHDGDKKKDGDKKDDKKETSAAIDDRV